MKKPRRITAFTTLREQDISSDFNQSPRGAFFRDSVGIGFSPIQVQHEDGGDLVIPTKPFQIPFHALIPKNKYINFLSAGKNIGATYVASTA